MTAVRVGRLTLSTASTNVTPTALDYENSETNLGTLFGGPTFTVKSNSTYSVSISYGATFTSPSSKPAQQVFYEVKNVGACTPTGINAGYFPLTAGGATTTIVSNASPTASRAQQLCIKVRWLWATDGPGAYILPIAFNITAP
jgi:hypothetical protein